MLSHTGHSIISVRVDKVLRELLSGYCSRRRLGISPFVRSLIVDFFESKELLKGGLDGSFQSSSSVIRAE